MNRAISERDEMYERSPDPAIQRHLEAHYFRIGQRAIEFIKTTMQLVGKTEVESILDLPCGHGRVLRYLEATFPEARLVACDIDPDGVGFCAETFGSTPVYSHERAAEISLGEKFDLIWSGSFFTHLDAPRWFEFLSFFESLLEPGGLFLFSTHGIGLYEIVRNLDLDEPKARMVRDYEETGFGYHQHPGKNWGGSMSSPAWVTKQLERLELELVFYFEKGYDIQDMVAMRSRSSRGPTVDERHPVSKN